MARRFTMLIVLAATLMLGGCGYNTLQSTDEQIKAGWAEVVNQYQRRADLVPNLVETVKGFRGAGAAGAAWRHQCPRPGRQHPGDAGTDQRSAGVRQIPGGPGRAHFRAVAPAGGGGELSAAQIGPRISATCRRSSKARKTASRWRATATSRRCRNTTSWCVPFPSNLTAMMFGFKEKPQFTVDNEKEISKAPKVDFSKPAAPAAAPARLPPAARRVNTLCPANRRP